MRLPARSAAWLLLVILTGCIHKSQVAQKAPLPPQLENAPPPQISVPPPSELPPPDATAPVQQPAPVVTSVPPPPRKQPKHNKPANTQQASIETPAVSAIGQLTSGDPAAADLRLQTDASIASTERQLNGIHRKLSDQEQKTADRVREFLKQARSALTTGDVDGAHTLAVKAKVLLDELHP